MKNTYQRNKAIDWWNKLSELKQVHAILRVENKIPLIKGRTIKTLTGGEIQLIYDAEMERIFYPEGLE